MRYLLDTHSFLWFITADRQMSDDARRLIEDIDNDGPLLFCFILCILGVHLEVPALKSIDLVKEP